MNKQNFFSLFLILSVILFAFGGMLITNYAIQYKKNQLLFGTGEVMTSPNAGLEYDVQTENGNGSPVLSAEKIMDIINRWKDASCEKLPHEPMEGQLSMEQAISGGKSWIDSMKRAGECAAGEEIVFHEVTAVLETCVKPEESRLQIDRYDSYWKLNFSSEQFRVCLYMNAVTGQVWEAWVEQYEESKDYAEDNHRAELEMFAELAGMNTEKISESEVEDKKIKLFFESTPLYVERAYSSNEIVEYQKNSYRYGIEMQE